MQVTLDKRYPVAVDAARAWQVLRDIRAVAGCMPGAQITEQVDASHYKGTVKVKVGPASASFAGDIEVVEVDEAARRIHLKARGADKSGSSASMDLTASIEPGDGGQSVLAGSATTVVNGKFAQFGSRMMGPVSEMVLEQFAANFATAAASPAAGSAESHGGGATGPGGGAESHKRAAEPGNPAVEGHALEAAAGSAAG
jgi:carbon monoxide dehydrogenase subunit G